MKRFFLTIFILIFSANCGFCAYDPATGEEISGYKGTLPDVIERFQKYIPQTARPNFQSVDAYNTSKGFKPVPRDNPTYVNVIIKKEKLSDFTNDINELIPIVENVISAITKNETEQLFAAKTNYLFDNAEVLRKKYEDKPEKYYPAYNAIISVSNHAKSIVSIRNEALVYSAYLPYQSDGYMYNPKYINEQLGYLLNELEETVRLMKEVE